MFENITRGCESKPPRLFIYGQEGVSDILSTHFYWSISSFKVHF